MFETTTHKIISSINRNEKVQIFYKDYDTHGFGCSYLFYKYFQKYEMLNNISFIPTDYFVLSKVVKDSIVILIDIDLNYNIVNRITKLSKKTIIIDRKESVINSLLRDNANNLNNISFFNHNGLSPIGIVWKLLEETNAPPEVLNHLNLSYCSEHSLLSSDNKISSIRTYTRSYEVWDKLIIDKEIEDIKSNGFINVLNRDRAVSISMRNAVIHNYDDYKVITINCPREDMDEIGVLSSLTPDCDFSITYEHCLDHYYYRVYRARDKDINLFKVFKNIETFGFNNRLWFRLETENNLFNKKKSFLQRLFSK